MLRPLPIASVNHLARETSRVDAMLAFYRDVLGFRQIWRPAFGFRGAWLANYGIQIHLIEGEADDASPEIDTRTDHVAFHTDDIDEVIRRLEENGIPHRVNDVPQTKVKQVFFHDPDGNHIEVGTYPPAREIVDSTPPPQ
jgi:catechol 2,3-dioxygenase-like lactoylglutathione lyase family enzyme